MRRALERLSRNVRLKRRLPNGAVVWVSPDSQLKYFRGLANDELVRLGQRYGVPGAMVWDIGANCGVFTFSALGAKEVVAVEADPFLCDLLHRSLLANRSRHIRVLPAAVSEVSGLAEFAIAERGRASNYLVSAGGRTQAGGERARFLVPTITLDGMLEHLAPPTFVKIDVEGAEGPVLRGAKRLMEEHRPVIYIEVERTNADECRALFAAAGYTISGDYNWLATPN